MQQGWGGRAPGIASGFASGSMGGLGSSADLPAAQPLPLENCQGGAELLQWCENQVTDAKHIRIVVIVDNAKWLSSLRSSL